MPTKRELEVLEERRRAQMYAQASITETPVDKNGKKIEVEYQLVNCFLPSQLSFESLYTHQIIISLF